MLSLITCAGPVVMLALIASLTSSVEVSESKLNLAITFFHPSLLSNGLMFFTTWSANPSAVINSPKTVPMLCAFSYIGRSNFSCSLDAGSLAASKFFLLPIRS